MGEVMLPPYVQADEESKRRMAEDMQEKRLVLNIGQRTEHLVRYILQNCLPFPVKLWTGTNVSVSVNGKVFYSAQLTDFIGNALLPGRLTRNSLYVEVKGVAPEADFPISRLTRQTPVMDELYADGNLVWLAIGWWFSEAPPDLVRVGARIMKKWKASSCWMELSLMDWPFWLRISEGRKTITRKNLNLLDGTWIRKERRNWKLEVNHWLWNVV